MKALRLSNFCNSIRSSRNFYFCSALWFSNYRNPFASQKQRCVTNSTNKRNRLHSSLTVIPTSYCRGILLQPWTITETVQTDDLIKLCHRKLKNFRSRYSLFLESPFVARKRWDVWSILHNGAEIWESLTLPLQRIPFRAKLRVKNNLILSPYWLRLMVRRKTKQFIFYSLEK